MDFEKLKEYRNKQNAFARLLNIKVEEVSYGYAVSKMVCLPDVLNPIGSVHGGCIFTLADVTGGTAACSYGEAMTTADANIHYLNAGRNCKFLKSVATQIKHGKRLAVYRVDVFDDQEQLLAEGTFTYVSLGKKLPYLED